jgi:hypothetical protein
MQGNTISLLKFVKPLILDVFDSGFYWDRDTGQFGLGKLPLQKIDIEAGGIRFSYQAPAACVAALKAATPGNIDNGTHSYKIVFVNALGDSIGGTASNVITVTDLTTEGQINLTAIPSGDISTTARKIYRTKAGGVAYFLVDYLPNNTATTYTDNIADVALVVPMPTIGADAGVVYCDSTEAMRFHSTGQLTFSMFPYTPSAAPTTDYQVANKKYVDDMVLVENLWDRAGTVLNPHTAQDSVSIPINALAATYSAGLTLSNNTSSLVGGVNEYPPSLNFLGHVKNTTSNLDETQEWRVGMRTVSGTTPSSAFYLRYSANGGGYTEPIKITNYGALSILGGLYAPSYVQTAEIEAINIAHFLFNFGGATSSATASRNMNDAYPAMITNLINASSTANIHCFHWQSILRACVNKTGSFVNYMNSDDTVCNSFASYKSRGLLSAKTICVSGDKGSTYSAYHYDGANDLETSRVVLGSYSASIGATRIGGVFEIWLRPDSPAGVLAKVFDIAPDGVGTIPTLRMNWSSKTADYALLTYDDGIDVSTSSVDITITLPTAVGVQGKKYIIKKVSDNGWRVAIVGTSAQTIDGALTRYLNYLNESVTVVSDGSNWLVI